MNVKVIMHLFVIFLMICTNVFGINSSLERGFIFVAEIPIYIPVETKEIEHLIREELKYVEKKGSVCSIKEDISCTYEIEISDKKVSKTWRGRFTPYEYQKHEKVDKKAIPKNVESVINLFHKQSLGFSDEQSIEEFEHIMQVIVLANRMKSIFSFINQELKESWDDAVYKNVCFLKGAWEPKWVKKEKDGMCKCVDVKEVRKYLHYCLDKIKEGSDNQKKYEKIVEALVEQERNKKIANHVPYHELREYLRTAKKRSEFVRNFVSVNSNAILYESTHDSDLVGLRVAPDGGDGISTGLYTHYIQMIKKHFLEENDYPDVLTTGYRAAPNRFKCRNDFAWFYAGMERERYVRAAAANSDYRVAYIPEPNCLYRVPHGDVCIKESFCELIDGKFLKITWDPTTNKKVKLSSFNSYSPCESPTIMTKRYLDCPESKKSKLRVLFDPTHPVFMDVPDRMLSYSSYNDLGTYFSGGSDDYYERNNDVKLLSFFSSISQSCFKSFVCSKTMYKLFGFKGKNFKCCGETIDHADNFFTLLTTWILNGCVVSKIIPYKSRGLTPMNRPCSVHLNSLGQEILKIGSISFFKKDGDILNEKLVGNFWVNISGKTFFIQVFFDPTQKKIYYKRDPSDGDFPQLFINAMPGTTDTVVQRIMNEIYETDIYDVLSKTASAMGRARLDFDEAFFHDPMFGKISQSKTSPKRAMIEWRKIGYNNPFAHELNLPAIWYRILELTKDNSNYDEEEEPNRKKRRK